MNKIKYEWKDIIAKYEEKQAKIAEEKPSNLLIHITINNFNVN